MSEKMELELETLLAEMAAEPRPAPGPALMARILADAAREQPPLPMPSGIRTGQAEPSSPRSLPGPRGWIGSGWIGGLAEVFGGRGALAGMMLATLAGLWLGVAQPVSLSLITGQSETPLDSLDLMAGSDGLWTEAAQ